MFLKNNMRPAFAAEGAGQARFAKPKNTAFTYDAGASETDDFGSFSQGATGGAPRRPRPNGNGKKGGFKLNPKAIIIAAAALVVLLTLIVVIVVAAVANSGGDVTYTNNAYVAYSDEDDTYHVVANGKVVGSYENEVKVIPAADRSFAYIIENIDGEGYSVSYVKGAKNPVEITTSPVTEVLATADLEPAVVYYEEANGIYLYTERHGEERMLKTNNILEYAAIKNSFHLSADGTTVVYNKIEANEANELRSFLCVWESGDDEVKFQKNMTPEAVSNDGKVIYASASRDGITKSLYVVPFNDNNDKYLIADNFNSIVDINIDGNEVVYTANAGDGKVYTYLAAFNLKKMGDEITPSKFSIEGIYKPFTIEGNVAMFETFKNTYFKYSFASLGNELAGACPIFAVAKDYSIDKISNFDGEFSPNGNFFYYINDKGNLMQKNLKSSGSAEKIDEGVEDFAVTAKGNLYWISDVSSLVYYNVAKDDSQRIADDVEYLSMHRYSNTLYFSFTDSMTIYTTSEGSDKKVAKFGTNDVMSIPAFSDDNAKAAYAAFYDEDNSEWQLFYTSNGKTFKTRVASCADIKGFETSDKYQEIVDNIINKVGDVIDGIIDGITGGNESEAPETTE
ncbi:MAG: hypothetical protein E7677_05365 [Ruminococcaceae bacterium]|nr:hypothetical protein [Oscillospiraceae bacterium]